MMLTFTMCLLSLLVTQVAEPKANAFPEGVLEILLTAEQIEVISLATDDELSCEDYAKYVTGKDGFHRHKPLGSVIVKDKDARKNLAEAISGAVTSVNPLEKGRCFIPRHGLRFKAKNQTVEMVICFNCKQFLIYVDDKAHGSIAIRSALSVPLNKILKDAKVPLAKGAEDIDK